MLVPEEGGLGSRSQVLLVSPEEVGLSIGHPEESGINLVSRQSSAQLLNVLGVARLQGSFIKHPVLVSWGGDRRAGSGSHLGSKVYAGDKWNLLLQGGIPHTQRLRQNAWLPLKKTNLPSFLS